MTLAVFASGGGTNFQALIDATVDGRLPARIALCVSNRADAGALQRARHAEIATCVMDPRTVTGYEEKLLAVLDAHGVDFIALAGYLRKIPGAVVRRFRGRMVNIHPALLPDFGGPGMYGLRVHQAVLAAGAKESGATVHFVDEEYDTGAIVLQGRVPVLPGDTPESLAKRVLEVEHRLYPEALNRILGERTNNPHHN